MIGRKLHLSNSMITTFKTSATETASEILGKHRQTKKPRVTEDILDLCDKRRELRKKRLEPEGSEKYKQVNNNIQMCMKKAKEDLAGEQCSEQQEGIPTCERLDYSEKMES